MQTKNWLNALPRNCLLPRRPDIVPEGPKAFTRRSLLRFIAKQRQVIVDRFADNEVAIERGRARATPELAEITKAALENLRAPESPRRLHVEVEGAVAVFAGAHDGSPLVQYWIACCGLPFAVRATCRWAELALQEEQASDGLRAWLVQRKRPDFDPGFDVPGLWESPWVQLRKGVSAADPDTYEVARHAAARIRRRAPLSVRCGLAFAFSAEAHWAEEDAFLLLQCLPCKDDEDLPGHLLALLASLRDAAMIERIVRTAIAHDCEPMAADYAWEILANVGTSAQRCLELLRAHEALERLKVVVSRQSGKESAA